jgi:hypothetical protein
VSAGLLSAAGGPVPDEPGRSRPRARLPATAPRHLPEREALGGIGLPQDRRAWIAARRAFINLKQTYLLALHELPGGRGEWLRHQVRRAEDPADLWLLRGLVLEALPGGAGRAALQRDLHALFPPRSPHSGFTPLF